MAKVLITGAGGGIGLMTTELLASQGYEVVATVRPSSDMTQIKALSKKYATLTIEYFDVLDALYYPKILKDLEDRHNGFDIVVMNAGVLYGGLIEKMTSAQIMTTVQTNLSACIAITSTLVEGMKERGQGKLIFISSLAASRPLPYLSVYNASKAGLEGLAKSLYLELAPSHIDVYLVEPGFYQTNLWRHDGDCQDQETQEVKKLAYFMTKPRDVKEVTFQILKICEGKSKRFHHTFGHYAKFQCLCKPFIYTKCGKTLYKYLLRRIK